MAVELLPVNGTSMMPALAPGSLVALERDPPLSNLQAGDILVIWIPETGPQMHRYLGRNSQGMLITQGDNCGSKDPPWTEDQVWARVLAVRPPERTTWQAQRQLAARMLACLSPFRPRRLLRLFQLTLNLVLWRRVEAPFQ